MHPADHVERLHDPAMTSECRSEDYYGGLLETGKGPIEREGKYFLKIFKSE
jgi:hypothetical protein